MDKLQQAQIRSLDPYFQNNFQQTRNITNLNNYSNLLPLLTIPAVSSPVCPLKLLFCNTQVKVWTGSKIGQNRPEIFELLFWVRKFGAERFKSSRALPHQGISRYHVRKNCCAPKCHVSYHLYQGGSAGCVHDKSDERYSYSYVWWVRYWDLLCVSCAGTTRRNCARTINKMKHARGVILALLYIFVALVSGR